MSNTSVSNTLLFWQSICQCVKLISHLTIKNTHVMIGQFFANVSRYYADIYKKIKARIAIKLHGCKIDLK